MDELKNLIINDALYINHTYNFNYILREISKIYPYHELEEIHVQLDIPINELKQLSLIDVFNNDVLMDVYNLREIINQNIYLHQQIEHHLDKLWDYIFTVDVKDHQYLLMIRLCEQDIEHVMPILSKIYTILNSFIGVEDSYIFR